MAHTEKLIGPWTSKDLPGHLVLRATYLGGEHLEQQGVTLERTLSSLLSALAKLKLVPELLSCAGGCRRMSVVGLV